MSHASSHLDDMYMWLIFLQVDQVLLEDPFRIVNSLESQGAHDFITYDDSKTQRERLPCFGFMFIRSTTRSQQIWEKLIKMMTKRLDNEQFFLQQLMRQQDVSLRFLPSKQFRNGVFLGGRGGQFTRPKIPSRLNLTNVAFIHANWVIGVESKREVLDYHLLFLHDDK
jgi:hypothetical protein